MYLALQRQRQGDVNMDGCGALGVWVYGLREAVGWSRLDPCMVTSVITSKDWMHTLREVPHSPD
jgi:hypothetical protein